MKNILLTAAAIICLVCTGSYAQDSLDYFPAHPGDKWFYDIPYPGGINITTIDSVSTDSVGKVVYISQTGDRVNIGISNRVVIDSAKGIVYDSYFNTQDSIWEYSELYHLTANIGDYWFYDSTDSSLLIGVDTIYTAAIFGKQTIVKRFEFFGGPENHNPSTWFWQNQEDYAYGIGMIYMRLEGAGERWYLEGAIINGDTLGTIFTGVKEPKNNAPSKFVLFQNYPNPFNSGTVIEYEIPTESYITLTIYDMLGRKIVTLFKGKRIPGHYTARWNANEFASGTYICRLTNGKFSKSIKLVHLK